MTNIIYVGVLAHLLDISSDEIEKSIRRQFEGKDKAIDLNINAVNVGRQWAKDNLKKIDPFKLKPMNATQGKIIIDGNGAAAIGCLFAGVSVVTWYPITPSSSLVEQLIDYLHDYRVDKEKEQNTFAVVQAEDELAAVGMALGAGWAGSRSMTATSGPGISLMSEFTGYGYFAEIPTVIFDIQRVGPSTGLPTRTSQGDLISTYFLSHGDTKHPILLPGSVEECYEFALHAFNMAERLQTPVFVLSDLDLGMNNWMTDPFEYPKEPIDRGKVLTAEDLDRIGEFSRYKDVDGDAIPYRTLPGTKHDKAAYFTRGSGHNEQAGYTEKSEDYINLMDRLKRKWENTKQIVPQSIVEMEKDAKIGVIAFGSSHWAVVESRDQLAEKDIPISYLRIRALPFTKKVKEFVDAHDFVYVVEQNRDGQMLDLIRLEYPMLALKLKSIRHYSGLPIDAQFITDHIVKEEN